MTTNEFERDVNDTAFLKRPGRIDLRILQNTPDCGDGHPGLQRCFRNYLHEGGMEKDLDLIGYGILGTSVNINNAELQQLSNIGASVITASIWTEISHIESVTITNGQWVFVGEADQPVKQADSPTFGGLSLTGNLVLAANSITGTSVNINNAEMRQLSNIGGNTISSTQWGYLSVLDQNLRQADSPTFANPIVSNLNLADDIIHVGDTNNLISFGTDTQDYQTGGSSRMDISDSGVRFGGANVRITGIIDNDSLGTSNVVLCTQGNVKAYVDNSSNYIPPVLFQGDPSSTWVIAIGNNGGIAWSIGNSEYTHSIYATFICPTTRSDWRILFVHSSDVTPRNAGGSVYVGNGAGGEADSATNIINGTSLRFNPPSANQYDYTSTATFSLNKGDTVKVRWKKTDDPGGGNMYLWGIYLMHN